MGPYEGPYQAMLENGFRVIYRVFLLIFSGIRGWSYSNFLAPASFLSLRGASKRGPKHHIKNKEFAFWF